MKTRINTTIDCELLELVRKNNLHVSDCLARGIQNALSGYSLQSEQENLKAHVARAQKVIQILQARVFELEKEKENK